MINTIRFGRPWLNPVTSMPLFFLLIATFTGPEAPACAAASPPNTPPERPSLPSRSSLEPTSASPIGCMDEGGNIIDYWVAFKKNAGFEYLYGDANDLTLAPSGVFMNDTAQGALASTARQLWAGLEYLAYNDEPAETAALPRKPPRSPYVESGHTKGVLAFNASAGQGFWLTHSVPLFPLTPEQTASYQGLGDNAYTYGQSFLCMTLTMPEINALAAQLTLNAPDIYSSSVSATTLNNFQGLHDLVNSHFPTSAACTSITIGHASVFAKTGAWDKDLWDDCIAPAYQADILVESWIRGSAVGPACPPDFSFTTLDVQYVSFSSNYQWKETSDHSKWAVGDTVDVVCFGDINRMTTQFSRGGGATCFHNTTLWQQIRSAVTLHGSC